MKYLIFSTSKIHFEPIRTFVTKELLEINFRETRECQRLCKNDFCIAKSRGSASFAFFQDVGVSFLRQGFWYCFAIQYIPSECDAKQYLHRG